MAKTKFRNPLQLYSVFFTDENNGFVFGRAMGGCLDEDCDKGCLFLKTTDGGVGWNIIDLNLFYAVNKLYCFDNILLMFRTCSTGYALFPQ